MITAASEIWATLVATDAVRPDSWDRALCDRLRESLGLDPALGMEEGLAAKGVDADAFIRAFFGAAQPHVAMWSALLALFKGAGATRGDDRIAVAYHFGDGDDPDVEFSFEHFRRAAELVFLATSRFDLREVEPGVLWSLLRTLGGTRANHPAVEDWVRGYRAEASWPDLPPPPPPAPWPDAQDLLDEAWQLAVFVLGELRAVSTSRADVVRLRDADGAAPGSTPLSLLADAENDMWLGHLVNVLYHAPAPDDPRAALADLDGALERFRNADPGLLAAQRRLQEFLDLPMWKQRYELFSNWVCCQVIDALGDMRPRVHVARDGTLRFRFSGTHLATFDAFDPPLHLFTELRSPLTDPIGEGRKAAIQPDITLVHDPVTELADSPLAIECKQYLKPDNRSFGHAISDYARGRPAARIILVDHGPVREATVVANVLDEVKDRARVVGDFGPGNDASLARFAGEVRDGLALPPAPAGPARDAALEPPPDAAGLIELTWTSPPDDLDLHLDVRTADGTHHAISYRNRGDAAAPPWCVLEEDVRDARSAERIVIVRRMPGAAYHLTVQRYGEHGTISGASARVRVVLDGVEQTFTPGDGIGQRWVIGDLHRAP